MKKYAFYTYLFMLNFSIILASSFDSEAEKKSLLCSLLSLSENDENDPE